MSRKAGRNVTKRRKLVTAINPASMLSEQYRTLRTNLKFSLLDHNAQTILITSASAGEGKSTTAANIAVVFAQEGKKTVIVDADMRKPSMHYSFHVTPTPGLSNLLVKQWSVKDVIRETGIDNLSIIPCGQIPSNPAELLSSSAAVELIAELKVKYDIIIFDAPPLLLLTDAQILANQCDGTVLVFKAGQTKKEQALRAAEVLHASKATILGTVLNGRKQKKHQRNNYYGY